MSIRKTIVMVDGPILPGTLSQVRSKCGKYQCRCHSGKTADLHGPYYRWSGYIAGKLSHRTLTAEAMRECERRIANYHAIQEQLSKLLEQSLLDAPWQGGSNPNRRKS